MTVFRDITFLAAGPASERRRSSNIRLGRFHRAGFMTARYRQALANTQQNSATQVAANRQGTAEQAFAARLKTMHEALEKAGVKHVTFESKGTSHEWQTWRRSLYDLAPRLFRD